MMRSLYSGVTGLRTHQTKMDVIGNNIANVNTVGYKGSRVTFQEVLTQTLRGPSAPQGEKGGINPMQVGLGVGLGTIETVHSPGNLQGTNNTSDLALEGDGFFIVSNGTKNFYTRAGAFTLENNARLVAGNTGMVVMGWRANKGKIDTNKSLEAIEINKGEVIEPLATSQITYNGNLDSRTTGKLELKANPWSLTSGANNARLNLALEPTGNFNEFKYVLSATAGKIVKASDHSLVESVKGTISLDANGTVLDITPDSTDTFSVWGGEVPASAIGDITTDPSNINALFSVGANNLAWSDFRFEKAQTAVTAVQVIDSLGTEHEIVMKFIKKDNNNWQWEIETPNLQPLSVTNGEIVFTAGGAVQNISYLNADGSTAISPTMRFGVPGDSDVLTVYPDFTKLNQFAQGTDLKRDQNGFKMGSLENYLIDSNGVITGIYSNGLNRALGQLALANFANPAGLLRAPGTLFEESSNSGVAQIGQAGTGGRGSIKPSTLEMSNVDLSQEFTEMIVTQRGFQANSRIITTSDEMLQEIVNLRR